MNQRARWVERSAVELEADVQTLTDLFFGELLDLSVAETTSASLKHKRWLGTMRIDMPTTPLPFSNAELVAYVHEHLQGREPFFFVRGGRIEGHYKIGSASDDAHLQVDLFALSLALGLGQPPTAIRSATICAYDLGDLETLASPDRRYDPHAGELI